MRGFSGVESEKEMMRGPIEPLVLNLDGLMKVEDRISAAELSRGNVEVDGDKDAIGVCVELWRGDRGEGGELGDLTSPPLSKKRIKRTTCASGSWMSNLCFAVRLFETSTTPVTEKDLAVAGGSVVTSLLGLTLL